MHETNGAAAGKNGAAAGWKCGLVPIRKRLAEIRPAPENDLLYRPITTDDPEIIALADSIQREGLLEPIVITTDDVIISGHRRYAACKRLGHDSVDCLVQDVRSDHPDFVVFLREHNRQRVKSLDEVVREEVVSADPEEPHRLLIEHRKQAARVDAEVIQIEGVKRRARITQAKQPFLNAILAVLQDLREFWPLTDRVIHYNLLNDPPLKHARKPASRYDNTVQSYKSLCELLTRARLTGQISYRAIDDPTRPVTVWACHREPGPFIRGELDGFLKGYYRDLLQSQPNHIEIIAEKLTIAPIIRPVAMEYCIPVTIGRGYSSLPPRYEMLQRFRNSGKQKLILLEVSDLDPEGENIPHSYARCMRDDFKLDGDRIVPIKVALTAQQVADLNLPPIMKAKETSSRHKKFVEKHGEDVFELEAAQPAWLQQALRRAIDSVLDLKAFNAEVDAEKRDAAALDGMRRAFHREAAKILQDKPRGRGTAPDPRPIWD
jgi:hypothetical protein